jgi:lipoate-protein ligase A
MTVKMKKKTPPLFKKKKTKKKKKAFHNVENKVPVKDLLPIHFHTFRERLMKKGKKLTREHEYSQEPKKRMIKAIHKQARNNPPDTDR